MSNDNLTREVLKTAAGCFLGAAIMMSISGWPWQICALVWATGIAGAVATFSSTR